MFVAALFIIVQIWNQPRYPSVDYTVCDIFIPWTTTQQQKEWTTDKHNIVARRFSSLDLQGIMLGEKKANIKRLHTV